MKGTFMSQVMNKLNPFPDYPGQDVKEEDDVPLCLPKLSATPVSPRYQRSPWKDSDGTVGALHMPPSTSLPFFPSPTPQSCHLGQNAVHEKVTMFSYISFHLDFFCETK